MTTEAAIAVQLYHRLLEGATPHTPTSRKSLGFNKNRSAHSPPRSRFRNRGSRGEPESRRPGRSFSRGVLSTWAAFRDRLALSRDSLEGSAEAWVRDLSLSAPGKRDLVKEGRDRVGIGGRFVEHPQPKLREVTLVQSQELQICPAAVHSPTFALKKRMAPNL